MDNAHLTYINWHLRSSLSLVTRDSSLILIIWLFSFLLVIIASTRLVFFLVPLTYGALFHVVAFLVSMIFRLLSIMSTVICLCNSLFFLVAFLLPCSGLGRADSNLFKINFLSETIHFFWNKFQYNIVYKISCIVKISRSAIKKQQHWFWYIFSCWLSLPPRLLVYLFFSFFLDILLSSTVKVNVYLLYIYI